jgi:methylmalonyl-CoA/ethylmalonyl-CoA epimerase
MQFRIDHVSIAVQDYSKALDFFKAVCGCTEGARAHDAQKEFYWQILSLGDLSRLELITPTGEHSFLHPFLKGRKGAVHHITLHTDNIFRAMAHLDASGIAYFGYHEYSTEYWKEVFIHPRDAFGVLIQIAEFKPDDFLDPSLVQCTAPWTLERAPHGCTLSLAHPGGGRVSTELAHSQLRQLRDAINCILSDSDRA